MFSITIYDVRTYRPSIFDWLMEHNQSNEQACSIFWPPSQHYPSSNQYPQLSVSMVIHAMDGFVSASPIMVMDCHWANWTLTLPPSTELFISIHHNYHSIYLLSPPHDGIVSINSSSSFDIAITMIMMMITSLHSSDMILNCNMIASYAPTIWMSSPRHTATHHCNMSPHVYLIIYITTRIATYLILPSPRNSTQQISMTKWPI